MANHRLNALRCRKALQHQQYAYSEAMPTTAIGQKQLYLHAKGLAQVWVLGLLPFDAKQREGCVFLVALKVSDEVFNHWLRDDIPNVLCFIVLRASHLHVKGESPNIAQYVICCTVSSEHHAHS